MTKPELPFLALPASVRRRIYSFAHLVRPCPIYLCPRSCRFESPTSPSYNFSCQATTSQQFREPALGEPPLFREGICHCPPPPLQLLLVSRAVHAEARDVLFRENTFAFCCAHGDLSAIPDTVLRALRHLVVWVDDSTPSTKSLRPPDPFCTRDPDQASDVVPASTSTTTAASLWALAAHHLARTLDHVSLRLELAIAPTLDVSSVRQAVLSLEPLPRLLECKIWLGKRVDPDTVVLARSTADKMVSKRPARRDPNAAPVALTRLPPEIRLRILKYALHGDGNPLVWEGGNMVILRGKLAPASHRCSHGRCYSCALSSCCSNRGVWQAVSLCRCRSHALAPLLASRQMYAEGAEVVYGSGGTILYGSFGHSLAKLQGLRPGTLALFRQLSIQLDFEQTRLWSKVETGFVSLLEFIGRHCDLSRLVLIIDATGDYLACSRRSFGEPTMQVLRDTYMSFPRWIKFSLPGLRGLRIRLGVHTDLETVLEKEVMGPEYGSNRGKRRPLEMIRSQAPVTTMIANGEWYRIRSEPRRH